MTRTLIEKLEAADEPSEALDLEIMLDIGGWRRGHGNLICPQSGMAYLCLPTYCRVTKSLDAAVALVERFGFVWGVSGAFKKSAASGMVYHPDWVKGDPRKYRANAPNPALALCIAPLKALEAREESE